MHFCRALLSFIIKQKLLKRRTEIVKTTSVFYFQKEVKFYMVEEKHYRVLGACTLPRGIRMSSVNVRKFINVGELFYIKKLISGLRLIKPEFEGSSEETTADRKGNIKKHVVAKSLYENSTTLDLTDYFFDTVGLMFIKKPYGWEIRIATEKERKGHEQNKALGNVSLKGYFIFSEEDRKKLKLNKPKTKFKVTVCADPKKGEYIKLERIDSEYHYLMPRLKDKSNLSRDMEFTYAWSPTDYKNGFFRLPKIFLDLCELGVSQLSTRFEGDDFIIEAPNKKCPNCHKFYSAYDTTDVCPECAEKRLEKAFDDYVEKLLNDKPVRIEHHACQKSLEEKVIRDDNDAIFNSMEIDIIDY